MAGGRRRGRPPDGASCSRRAGLQQCKSFVEMCIVSCLSASPSCLFGRVAALVVVCQFAVVTLPPPVTGRTERECVVICVRTGRCSLDQSTDSSPAASRIHHIWAGRRPRAGRRHRAPRCPLRHGRAPGSTWSGEQTLLCCSKFQRRRASRRNWGRQARVSSLVPFASRG